MRKKILLFLLTFPLALLSSSCAQNVISKDNLVDKKWSLRSSKIISLEANNKEAIKKIKEYSNYDVTKDRYKDYLIFGDDGTVKSFFYIETSEVNDYVEKVVTNEGTYSLEGDILTLKSDMLAGVKQDRPTEVVRAKILRNELHTEKEYSAEELKEAARTLNYINQFPGLEISKLVIKKIHIIIE